MSTENILKASKVIASAQKLTKTFDKTQALNGVSLEIYKGEILSILGPNGAGKTTLINIMLGKLQTTTGELSIFGMQPGVIDLKRQLGAMLQVASMPDMSTVKEHIQLFQSYYPQPMEYEKVISYAGLKDLQNNYSKNLSGGQKQRLLFALAICGNPKLLFLDEPTVGLDVTARKSLWKAILDLKKQGASIVLTTHYLEEADQLSDRIIMLNQGEVLKTGTPQQIKSQVNSKLICFKTETTLQQLLQLNHVKEIEQSGSFFEIKTKHPVRTIKEIFESNIDIDELTITGAALEDAFVALNQKQDSIKK